MLTPEQIEARKGLITSSVAPACLGMHPYMTPLQAKHTVKGATPPVEYSKGMEFGDWAEVPLLIWAAKKLGLRYEPAPFVRHPNGWSGDSCDGLFYREPYVVGLDEPVALGEAKSAGIRVSDQFEEDETDLVPIYYWIQGHWHLAHWNGPAVCHVPAAISRFSGNQLGMYHIHRDTETEGKLLERCERFHRDYIVGDKDPPANSKDLEWLKETYAKSEHVDLLVSTPEIDAIAMEWRQAKLDLEAAEECAGTLRAQLEQYIGAHSGVETAIGKITWKSNKPSQSIDWEWLAHERMKDLTDDERNALILRATRTKPGARQFRGNWKKEKA